MATSMDHVTPGTKLGNISDDTIAGAGTYVTNNQIYSSLAGLIVRNQTNEGQICLTVKSMRPQNLVPTVNSLVAAKVTKVNSRFCRCSIFAVDNQLMSEPFHGIIRREDVRATQKDKVEMHKCFKPTDVILAKVVSLGDTSAYHLSTAENELGVVVALSEAGPGKGPADEKQKCSEIKRIQKFNNKLTKGVSMSPISWNEMQCPLSLKKEFRKVAKVQPRYLNQLLKSVNS